SSLKALFIAPDPLGSSFHSRRIPFSSKGCSSTVFTQGKLKCSGTPTILILSISKDRQPSAIVKLLAKALCCKLVIVGILPTTPPFFCHNDNLTRQSKEIRTGISIFDPIGRSPFPVRNGHLSTHHQTFKYFIMKFKPGVKYGEELRDLLAYAKESEFAMPAVNVINSNTVNAVLETAKKVNSPVMIQFSNGGAQFFAGKSLANDKQQASIAGGISGALHVHKMAEAYGVPVVLHTDHAAKKLLPWIDGLLAEGKAYYEAYKK